ncbi:hypothetical protein SH2C18_28010 [Clostridium sediminicola]|uniref:LuxR C-terminal-related transcriptional regulator n=1 Tax=Clostridium sediminicola TaxID=3114879 RepID=UPI0031F2246C
MKDLIEEKMNKTIIARDYEMNSVKKHFDRVLEDNTAVVFIKGGPGIGKTFFVEHVVRELASNDVTFVYGKNIQNNKRPFIAISEIIEEMTKHVLTLPYEQLKNIKSTISKVLGDDIEIITTISPLSRKLFPKHKSINIDNYEKLKYRIKKVLYQFLSTISEALFPLIIFIDDIQWIDKPSFELIESICKDSEGLNLMLILAYRDNEQEFLDKVKTLTKIKNIQNRSLSIILQPLTERHIKEYINLVLGKRIENSDYLVRIIYGITSGNPFYIKTLLDIFVEKDILAFLSNKEKWIVNFHNMNKFTLPKDIEQMIYGKITMLSDSEKAILQIIACFDGKATYSQIKGIIDCDEISLKAELKKLCERAFIVPKTLSDFEQQIIRYDFIHDIPLEVVYKDIAIKEREDIHYKIAKTILFTDSKFVKNSRLFMASQLLRSNYESRIGDCTNLLWINHLYDAGIEAKQTTAVEQALKIFELCLLFLKKDESLEFKDLEMKIELELAECKFLCEDIKSAIEIFQRLIEKHNTDKNIIIIKSKYMNMYSYIGESDKAIELGIEVLSHLGFSFDLEDFNSELLKVQSLFSDKKIEELINAPSIQDERILTILEILNQMIPPANYLDYNVFTLILVNMGVLSAEHGSSSFSPLGYAACSFIFYHVWNDYKKGERLANITLELLRDTEDSEIKDIVYSFMATFVTHWYKPFGKSIDYLDMAIEEGIKAGEFVYSSYGIVSSIYAKYVMGKCFEEIKSETYEKLKALQNVGTHALKFNQYFINLHLKYLQKGSVLEKDKGIIEEPESYDSAESVIYYVLKLQRLYLEGEFEKAYSIVENIRPYIGLLKGHIMYMEIVFFCILARQAQHKELEENQKEKNKSDIQNDLKELKEAIEYYDGNHYIRYLLTLGSYEAIFEDGKRAANYYNEAISLSERDGNIYLEALGNTLAARYYKKHKKLCEFYAKEAIDCYERWGATYIARKIEKEFEILVMPFPSEKQESNMVMNDILNHINRIEEMNEKQGFAYILDYLLKKSVADFGAILFEKCDEMHVAYKCEKEGQVYAYPDIVNIKFISNMSRKIIRYVARTGEEVFLKNKPSDGIFAKDIYIMDKENISIICVPMHYMGIFIGLIYLESIGYKGLDKSIVSIIKGVIPSLMLKQTIIKNINIHNILHPKKGISSLTERELEILELVADGLSNTDISKKFFISLGTVKSHLNNIYSKLEVDSRIKAVVKAKEMNIIKQIY